jgi:hypothetical protein
VLLVDGRPARAGRVTGNRVHQLVVRSAVVMMRVNTELLMYWQWLELGVGA